MYKRIGYRSSWRRDWAVGIVAALSWGELIGQAVAQAEEGGCCPQSSRGWVLFEDDNRRVPDFWKRDSVVVDVIDVCRHGVNFYFVSEEDGQPRYVALVFVKPSRELFETRVIRRVGDPPIETRLQRACQRYTELLANLERFLDVRLNPEGRLDFTNRPFEERPVISRRRGLSLRWRGGEIDLRGYLDVYMTMFS